MVRSLSRPSAASADATIDPKRIAANTGVVFVHALVFAALMLPSSWEAPPARLRSDPPVVIDEYVQPEPIPTTQPPPDPKPEVKQEVVPVQTPVVVPDTPPVDTRPIFETGEIAAVETADTGPPADTFDTGPQLETLAYDVHPAPRYPRTALRAGDEGRVLLRVLVGPDGRPLEVIVEKGSGHRDLDRAAREQVLAAWRFHPAVRGGRAVSAWALVPIDFVMP